MKNMNVTLTALLVIGFTGLAYGEMGKCNGTQNSNMQNKSGMMEGNQSVGKCNGTQNSDMKKKSGMMEGNQSMGKCNGSMQGNQGMMGGQGMMNN